MGPTIDAVLAPAEQMLLQRRGGVARLPEHYEALSSRRTIRPNEDPPYATYVRAWGGTRVFAAEISGTAITSTRERRHLDSYPHWVGILLPLQGVVHFEQNHRGYELRPGEAGCIVSDWEHRLVMRPGSRLAVVYMPEESLRFGGLALDEIAARKWMGGVVIPTLSVMLQGLMECRATGSKAHTENTLLHLAINVLNADPIGVPAGTEDERLRARVWEIIENRLHDPHFTVELLARELELSRRALYSLLRPLGMSAGAMLRERRVNRGVRLIQTRPEASLGEVAVLCGFGGRDQFTRAFKAILGMTPTQFRVRSEQMELDGH